MVATVSAVALKAMQQNMAEKRADLERKFEDRQRSMTKSKYKDASRFRNPLCKRYIQFAAKCDGIVKSDSFNLFVILVIICAGVIVGLQTYPTYEFDATIEKVDTAILGIFAFECILKICAEAMAPWVYLTGQERGWNIFDLTIVIMSLPVWGSTFGGNSVKLLRLTRLMRVMKLVKKIPQLQMIVMGLIGGLKSIVYILALLVLVFYLYAIVGFYAFNENDKFHFGSVPIAFVTLFRMATLEDWTDVMYIQYFGCDTEMYDASFISSPTFGLCVPGMTEVMKPSRGSTIIYFVTFVVISALVMLSLFVGAVTMSMTESMATMKLEAELNERRRRLMKAKKRAEKDTRRVNIILHKDGSNSSENALDASAESIDITDGEGNSNSDEETKKAGLSLQGTLGAAKMKQKLENLKKKAEDKKKGSVIAFDDSQKKVVQNVLNIFSPNKGASDRAAVHPTDGSSPQLRSVSTGRFRSIAKRAVNNIKSRRATTLLFNPFAKPQPRLEELERVRAAFKGAWEGIDLMDLLDEDFEHEYENKFKREYAKVSRVCKQIIENPIFGNFIIFTIIVASLLVGITTEASMNVGYAKYITNLLDWIVLCIFFAEIILKTCAERFYPMRYFVKFGQIQGWNCFDYFVVIGSLLPGSGSMLTMLRLLRLLRVLKLVKSLPELQVIIVALIGGLTSISYIGVILFLVFYVFAIMAMILFSESDPWHFGTLHFSLISLLRIATLDDWTDVMYINMYGCDKYGYTGFESLCTKPIAFGGIAAMFFITFVLIGALVLMTLFIGVVTTSMEEATAAQKEQAEFQERIENLKTKHRISEKTMRAYQNVFKMLDLDGSGTIEEEELRFGLHSIGKCPGNEQLSRMIAVVDDDGSGEIDFVEFVKFMRIVKRQGGSAIYEPGFEYRGTWITTPQGEGNNFSFSQAKTAENNKN